MCALNLQNITKWQKQFKLLMVRVTLATDLNQSTYKFN